jgi:hypothetical protein
MSAARHSYGVPGTLELNRNVGPGETIAIQEGHLKLSDIKEFHGTIDLRHPLGPPGYADVLLEGVNAFAYHYDQPHNLLTLFEMKAPGWITTDAVHVQAAVSSAPAFGGAYGWQVVSTAGGDEIRRVVTSYGTPLGAGEHKLPGIV